jgi:uncharacterized protein YdeI (YjbR/CyaY-like superfamily)
MDIRNSIYLTSRADWRSWLETHHASERELWLIFYKNGQANIPLEGAIEEALSFGWIDSIIQKIDEERYARLFTPRTNTAKWSALNRRRVQKLIAEGRMTPAGLALLPADWDQEPVERPHPEREELPEFIRQGLEGNPQAKTYFESLPPSHKRMYLGWILDAKRDETRLKRLAEALRNLEQGKRMGLK